MKLKSLLPLIPAALVLGAMMFPSGCANTTASPSGGPKDTIPPVIVKLSPLPGATNVPVHNTTLRFTFNEYVKIKEAKSIFLSPPQEKNPKAVIKGKSVVVTFEEDLLPNTTYTLDLNDAIVDNNEGNLYPGYTLVFSTGDQIDSMCVTGLVQDCNTLMPVKGATVLFYKDHADSAVFLHRPDAAVRTDDWGFFSLRNIKDTLYRVYAIRDENNNNIYDPETETVAFLDSLFRPVRVINDTLYEFKKFDMKDTTLCLARKTEMELSLFREPPSKQMIVKKERVGLRTGYLTFMRPNAVVHDMRVKGLPREKLISQFNAERDSLELWVNDPRKMPDTLQLVINYDKTDTNGVTKPTDETVKLVIDKKLKQETGKRSSRDIKHEDTLCVYKTNAEPTMLEQYGFELEFTFPIVEDGWDSLQLRSVNPRQQEALVPVTITQDTLNLRKYRIMPTEPFKKGFDYILRVPHRRFRDINGYLNDSSRVKVTLPDEETFASIQLDLSGVHNKYIIDLLNEKRNKVIRSFIVTEDGPVQFPYLKEGNYCIRITEDRNRNNLVDTGNLLEHRQPEKVQFFKVKDQFLIKVLDKAEMVWTVDMEELFK